MVGPGTIPFKCRYQSSQPVSMRQHGTSFLAQLQSQMDQCKQAHHEQLVGHESANHVVLYVLDARFDDGHRERAERPAGPAVQHSTQCNTLQGSSTRRGNQERRSGKEVSKGGGSTVLDAQKFPRQRTSIARATSPELHIPIAACVHCVVVLSHRPVEHFTISIDVSQVK